MQPAPLLNTPIQRIGLLVLLIGLAMLIASLAIIAFETYGIRDFWHEVVHYWNRPFRGRSFNLLHYGTAFAIIGIFLSFLYDSTIGRIVNWIKHG